MKKALAVIAAALAAAAAWLFLYEPDYAGRVRADGSTGIYAHRGFGDDAPDNALVSAQLAMQAKMDGVDVDGQLSADGELVIFHDLSVDRLTHASGRVTSKTVAELRALDLGAKYGKGFEGRAPVATFDDFVREVTPHGILMVELKAPGAGATGIEQAAAGVIAKYDAWDKVFLSSFNPIVLYRLKQIDPRIRTVLIFMDTNWNAELLAEIPPADLVNLPWPLRQEPIRRAIRKLIKPDGLSINHEVDADTTRRLLDKGWPVFIWTIDNAPQIEKALGQKPYGIISDQPVRAKQLRDQRSGA